MKPPATQINVLMIATIINQQQQTKCWLSYYVSKLWKDQQWVSFCLRFKKAKHGFKWGEHDYTLSTTLLLLWRQILVKLSWNIGLYFR